MDTRNPELATTTLKSCPALDIEWEDPYEGDLCAGVAQLQGMLLHLLNKAAGIGA
ncbi:hypothetical protein LCGC14_1405780 [marine sediment metagenome]|uniref:Uncharacterized protein n=1 Tax=marine sediment metagenome TaxID=412755 RepID=A0A0F9JW25_9ZZZZ